MSEVLAPILLQYGWNINEVDVYVDEDTTIAGAGDDKVDLVSNVGVIDNKRLFVVQKSHEEIQKVCAICIHFSCTLSQTGMIMTDSNLFCRLRILTLKVNNKVVAGTLTRQR